jgi:DNA-binding winged helix-turn-helix (wHTH) protein
MRVAFGRFEFDADSRELLEDGRRVRLSPKAFDLLKLLLERRPNVVSKNEVHERVWPGAFVGDANLSVVIAEIRHALGDDSRHGEFIRTVHRVGYAFCGPVRAGSAASGPPPAFGYRSWLVWEGRSLPLPDGETIVGRDPRCGVLIEASGVSRRHVRIVVTPAQVTIEDLDSSNGTFVGGQKVTGVRTLADGDEIELGSATATVRVWSDERAAKTERIPRAKR